MKIFNVKSKYLLKIINERILVILKLGVFFESLVWKLGTGVYKFFYLLFSFFVNKNCYDDIYYFINL